MYAWFILIQPDNTPQLLQAQKSKQAFYYNNGTKELKLLEPGDTVRIYPSKYRKRCTQATVEKQVGMRSYHLVSDDGRAYRRNRGHLRLTAEAPRSSPPADTVMPISKCGPLLSTNEQAPPVTYPVPQELINPQLAPTPQADEVTNPMPQEAINAQAAPGPQADILNPARCSSRGEVLQRPAYLNDYACWYCFLCCLYF